MHPLSRISIRRRYKTEQTTKATTSTEMATYSRLNTDAVASTVFELSSTFHQAIPKGVADIVHSYLAPLNVGPGVTLKVKGPNGSVHEAVVLFTFLSPKDSLLFVDYPECHDPSTREWLDLADPQGRSIDGLLLTCSAKHASVTSRIHRPFHRQLELSCRRQAEFLLLAREIDESLPLQIQEARLLTDICNIRSSFATALSMLLMLCSESVRKASIWGVRTCPLCNSFMYPERFVEHALFDCVALLNDRNDAKMQLSNCTDESLQDSSRIELANYMLVDAWNSPAVRFERPSVVHTARRSMMLFLMVVYKRLRQSHNDQSVCQSISLGHNSPDEA